jgi:hypothetical protein
LASAAADRASPGARSSGRIPAHPKVQPTDKVRPDRIYALTVADYKEFPKYNKIWKEIFKLR